MATKTIPANTKTKVATSERIDNRPIPQTPWPLVHPLPICVPMPTNNPASTSTNKLRPEVLVKNSGFKYLRPTPPTIKPMTKAVLHFRSVPCLKSIPLKIPEIPVILPLNNNIIAEAIPIKTPPKRGIANSNSST